MTPAVLLSTTYFGPVQWYQKLNAYPQVRVEAHESFAKQTYRNRCIIATANGPQALTVPVGHSDGQDMASLRISDHGNWRHLHWQAIVSAYGDSPFLEYYEDDLRPFFTEHRWEYLLDFNEDIRRKMCELLDISPAVSLTDTYVQRTAHLPGDQPGNPDDRCDAPDDRCDDFRDAIRPKHPADDPSFTPRPYYQVFARRHGFLPNLSILDLLLNMGPEAIFFL